MREYPFEATVENDSHLQGKVKVVEETRNHPGYPTPIVLELNITHSTLQSNFLLKFKMVDESDKIL